MLIKVAINLYLLLYSDKQETLYLNFKTYCAQLPVLTLSSLMKYNIWLKMKQDMYKVILAFANYLDGTDSIIHILEN